MKSLGVLGAISGSYISWNFSVYEGSQKDMKIGNNKN